MYVLCYKCPYQIYMYSGVASMHIDALNEDEDAVVPPAKDPLHFRLLNKQAAVKRYKCLSCHEPRCDKEPTCNDALQVIVLCSFFINSKN